MELRHLETFIKVAEFQNFSKAADQLKYAQSTVTMQIKQLENELGFLLFERIGKRISLTNKGIEFLDYAYAITKCTSEALEAMSGNKEPSGILKIGIVESLCTSIFKDIFKEFLIIYPKVELVIKIGTTSEIMEMLNKSQVDFIVALDNKINNPNWVTVFEKEEAISFFCSNKHPLAKYDEIPLQKLINENFILTEKECNYRESFEQILNKINLSLTSSLEIENTDIIIKYVKENLGISFLPKVTLLESVSKSDIHILSVPNCSIPMYTQLIYKKNKWLSPSMQAFFSLSNKVLFNNI